MILTDYFLPKHDIMWDFAKQCGVEHAVVRLPEDDSFDITNKTHWQSIYDRFINFGIKPLVIEPMPNALHTHIKIGDAKRDESIEKVIKMMFYMREFDMDTVCFNWMAHIGWLRTSDSIRERGGALVTGFNLDEFIPEKSKITFDYGKNATKIVRELLNRWKRQYESGIFDEIVLIGMDDDGFENSFNFSTVLSAIEFQLKKESDDRYDEEKVKNSLISKLGE